MITGFLDRLIQDVMRSVSGPVETYLLSTRDLSSLGATPLTANPAVVTMYHLTVSLGDLLLVLVVSYAFLRSQWEHSIRPRYTLKVLLPRLMLAVALAHFALLFGQMAIDLNNALIHAVWSASLPIGAPRFPWLQALTQGFGQPLFQLMVRLAIVVMLVIIALTYVVRFALLSVLLVLAPLAALCTVLPETKSYANAWVRLFLVTVFMQFVQVLILRFASLFETGPATPIQALYGLAVLYLLIKVPGLLNASAHLEGKAEHLAGSVVKHAYKSATATPRVRAGS